MTPFLLLSAICTSIGFLTAILPGKHLPLTEPKDMDVKHQEEPKPYLDPMRPF